MAADLFAPPTSKELAMFAPPTETELQTTAPEAPGYSESLLRGGVQGGTLGFSDELSGAKEALMGAARGDREAPGWLNKLQSADLLLPGGIAQRVGEAAANIYKGDASKENLVKNYIQSRDAERAANAAARKANPWTYGGGELAGNLIGGSVLPIARAGSLGGRVAAAGAMGGAQGLGSSNADLTKGEVRRAAIDTGIGAATGAVTQRMLETIPGLLSGDTAEKLAVRHLRPTPQTARNLGPEKLQDIGREALDSGAIKFGSNIGETQANLAEQRMAAGALKSDLVNASQGTADPLHIAERFQREVIDPLKETSENQGLVEALQTKKDAFLKHYIPEYATTGKLPPEGASMPIQALEGEKMAVQNNINYKVDPNSKVGANRDWARILKEETEKGINDPAFNAAKRATGNFISADEMAQRTAGLTDGGNGLLGHLTDVGMGSTGLNLAAHGNPLGPAIVAGRAMTKGRVASAGAVAANEISGIAKGVKSGLNATGIIDKLNAIPGAARFSQAVKSAAMQGPGALAATHFILQQTEPEYQKAVSQQ